MLFGGNPKIALPCLVTIMLVINLLGLVFGLIWLFYSGIPDHVYDGKKNSKLVNILLINYTIWNLSYLIYSGLLFLTVNVKPVKKLFLLAIGVITLTSLTLFNYSTDLGLLAFVVSLFTFISGFLLVIFRKVKVEKKGWGIYKVHSEDT